MDPRSETSRALSQGLKYTLAATGSLAVTWAGTMAAKAQPFEPPNVDPRFANAFDSWSVGVGLGYNLFQTPTTIDSFDGYGGVFDPTLQGNSPFVSVEIGKDFRFNNAVFGLYGDFHIGEKTGSFESSDLYSQSAHLTLKHGGAITGRAGVVANPRTLVYGLFGWSWQHYSASVSGSSDAYTSISAEGSGILNGPTVGLGAEVLFPNDPNMSFKGEYRYTHFSAPATLSANGGDSTMTFGPVNDHMLRFMMTFKFGAPPG